MTRSVRATLYLILSDSFARYFFNERLKAEDVIKLERFTDVKKTKETERRREHIIHSIFFVYC